MQPESGGRAHTLRARFSGQPVRLQLDIPVYLTGGQGDVEARVSELGITQPKAKLEARLDVRRVKVPIVDEQAMHIVIICGPS
jgi:hypothetical protein